MARTGLLTCTFQLRSQCGFVVASGGHHGPRTRECCCCILLRAFFASVLPTWPMVSRACQFCSCVLGTGLNCPSLTPGQEGNRRLPAVLVCLGFGVLGLDLPPTDKASPYPLPLLALCLSPFLELRVFRRHQSESFFIRISEGSERSLALPGSRSSPACSPLQR